MILTVTNEGRVFVTKTYRDVQKREKYKPQLEVLVELLSQQLGEPVTYTYDPDEFTVVVQTEVETIARITVHSKGELRRNYYVRVRTEKPVLTALFQLAFIGMKVAIAPLEKKVLRK